MRHDAACHHHVVLPQVHVHVALAGRPLAAAAWDESARFQRQSETQLIQHRTTVAKFVTIFNQQELDYVAQAYVIPRVPTKCKEMK